MRTWQGFRYQSARAERMRDALQAAKTQDEKIVEHYGPEALLNAKPKPEGAQNVPPFQEKDAE